jgi:hypothetical protein
VSEERIIEAARLDFAVALAWLDRKRAIGTVIQPATLNGYAHSDSVEIDCEGPVMVLGATREAWIRNETRADFDGLGLRPIVDTYWDVVPIGWTPRCPETGQALTSCWAWGPSYFAGKGIVP